MLPDEAQLLIGAIKRNGVEILTYPGGWPENVELALIDTVLSIRARYGTSPETGVRGAIKRYRAETGRPSWNDLGVLAETDSAWLQGVLANQQKTGGVPKAEAIVSAAGRLVRAGAVHAADIDRNSAEQRNAYCGTEGLGPVTWEYFLMLIGHDGVKADTLLTRFVAQAIGSAPSTGQVVELVSEAAKRQAISATVLDHSIWRYMSNARKD